MALRAWSFVRVRFCWWMMSFSEATMIVANAVMTREATTSVTSISGSVNPDWFANRVRYGLVGQGRRVPPRDRWRDGTRGRRGGCRDAGLGQRARGGVPVVDLQEVPEPPRRRGQTGTQPAERVRPVVPVDLVLHRAVAG